MLHDVRRQTEDHLQLSCVVNSAVYHAEGCIII